MKPHKYKYWVVFGESGALGNPEVYPIIYNPFVWWPFGIQILGNRANSYVLGFWVTIPNTSSENIFRFLFDARIWGNHVQHLLGKHRITSNTSSEREHGYNYVPQIWDGQHQDPSDFMIP